MADDRDLKLPYQPALDGLRAFAVLAVVAYHLDYSWARGGFLGVDLFFVLSGYLITSLLLREWEHTGTVRLRAFWARRARRLLPAILLLLAGISAYAATDETGVLLDRLRWDGLATLGYFANWRFVLSGQSYFDLAGPPSPLRHMWSLAIEE
ncbi:MAG TPA: acyltransferase, partial [Acidimicrobiales bacterium]|nr:acyltransferase [Acidimicrobiales bacterium]